MRHILTTLQELDQIYRSDILEAVLAGQQELQKTAAREVTVMNLGTRLTRKENDHEERITELEKERNIPHPHKHSSPQSLLKGNSPSYSLASMPPKSSDGRKVAGKF